MTNYGLPQWWHQGGAWGHFSIFPQSEALPPLPPPLRRKTKTKIGHFRQFYFFKIIFAPSENVVCSLVPPPKKNLVLPLVNHTKLSQRDIGVSKGLYYILSQWVWFSMSTRNFIGSAKNSAHPSWDRNG